MTSVPCLPTWLPVACALALVLSTPPPSASASESPESALTRARVAAEVGELEGAAALLADLDRDDVPRATRLEALLALGRVEAERGRSNDSIAAFRKVAQEAATDPELRWRLAEAVTRVTPDARGWLAGQSAVELGVGRHGEDPVAVMRWPGADRLFGEGSFTGDPIAMSLKGAGLREVLESFSTIGGIGIEIPSCLEGWTVTLSLAAVPWDRALYDILGSRGLPTSPGADGTLVVGCPPSVLPAAGASKGREPIAVHLVLDATRHTTSRGMCRPSPALEVDAEGLDPAAAAARVSASLDGLEGREAGGPVEICGAVADLETLAAFVDTLEKFPRFLDPAPADVRLGESGETVFRIVAILAGG